MFLLKVLIQQGGKLLPTLRRGIFHGKIHPVIIFPAKLIGLQIPPDAEQPALYIMFPVLLGQRKALLRGLCRRLVINAELYGKTPQVDTGKFSCFKFSHSFLHSAFPAVIDFTFCHNIRIT